MSLRIKLKTFESEIESSDFSYDKRREKTFIYLKNRNHNLLKSTLSYSFNF